MKKSIVCVLLCPVLALFISSCGDKKADSGKPSAVAETAKGADKTADYLIGKAPMEQGKKATQKVNKAQEDYNKKLEQAMQD